MKSCSVTIQWKPSPSTFTCYYLFYNILQKGNWEIFSRLNTHTLGNPAWITELYNPLNQANKLHQFEQRPFITLN